ncbi:hypothetical protein [Leucothrix pacifica]|uniref:Cell filamentation protein Fic n=1 Tax=Leucothrix pacifica TaxID=1247513 RepID=A0A317CAI4_9GAMM|nr:hypothetical protein [Leucothrix pacifica]PWQ95634.1 hypothetical protein DKW60_14555 [Leucothrix pacifica]
MTTVNELLQSIQEAENSISLGQILEIYPDLNRRTAQRWLRQLIDGNKIIAEGSGPARAYRPLTEGAGSDRDIYPNYIPLSADSRDILDYIDQPLEACHPVGYDITFLQDYQPNESFYLSETLRR